MSEIQNDDVEEFNLDSFNKDIKHIEQENDHNKYMFIRNLKMNESELISEIKQNRKKREAKRKSWLNKIAKTFGF
jgi:hypothetical protein